MSPLPSSREIAPPEQRTSISSPVPSTRELAPPQIPKTVRSGSSSSMVSVGSAMNNPNPSESSYRPRPSLDEPRGSALGRSPLSGGIELGRTISPGPTSAGVRGLGLGNPRQSFGSEGALRPAEMARKGSSSSANTRTEEMSSSSMARQKSSDSATRRTEGLERGDIRPPSRSERSPKPPTHEERVPSPPPSSIPQPPSSTIPQPPSRSIPPPSQNGDIRKPPPPAINAPPPNAPTITTTLPSPLIPQEPPPAPTPTSATGHRINRRPSFHPAPTKTAFSREVLLTSKAGLLPGGGLTVTDDSDAEDAILANVEEMLEGFDWTAGVGVGGDGRKKGSADAIEGRLLDELAALDSVSCIVTYWSNV
jgi:hypothetical protein